MPEDRDQTKVVALSRKLANKYFGDEDPIWKVLQIDDKDFFTVAAVFEDITFNSTIRFDFWAPVKLMESEEIVGIEGLRYEGMFQKTSFWHTDLENIGNMNAWPWAK